MDQTLQIFRALGILATLLLADMASASSPPTPSPHSDESMRHYVYFPAHRIYFEPDQRAWFWYREGRWYSDSQLPAAYKPLTHDGVYVDLDTERPYERQSWIEQQFGTPAENERRHPDRHNWHGARDRDPYPTVSA